MPNKRKPKARRKPRKSTTESKSKPKRLDALMPYLKTIHDYE